MIERILKIPAAAQILASKIIGRVIGQVANGFHQDPQLIAELSVYKAIQAKYPVDTVTLPDMFKSMVKRASNEVPVPEFDVALSNMDAEQRELWSSGRTDKSERQALIDAMPRITGMYVEAANDATCWNDLSTIAQWSLLNHTEAALPEKVRLYSTWRGTNGTRLLTEANEAIVPFAELVSEFLNDEAVQADLANEAANNVQVPERLVA